MTFSARNRYFSKTVIISEPTFSRSLFEINHYLPYKTIIYCINQQFKSLNIIMFILKCITHLNLGGSV
jgi:hypothetical protein